MAHNKLLIASQNPGKFGEIHAYLHGCGLELLSPMDYPQLASLEVEETGLTFAENAELKARAFAQKSQVLTLADDSGLLITILDDFPGVHSKRIDTKPGQSRLEYILERLEGKENRQARMVTVLCLYDPQEDSSQFFEGMVNGSIGYEERGTEGFDYDRFFVPEGYNQTFAQLGQTVKDQLSHRSHALSSLKEYLLTVKPG